MVAVVAMGHGWGWTARSHRIRRTTDDDEQPPGSGLPDVTTRVRAVLQGLGRTGDIDRAITYEQMADDAVKLVDHLGVDSADDGRRPPSQDRRRQAAARRLVRAPVGAIGRQPRDDA
jgi:hypothetical protein